MNNLRCGENIFGVFGNPIIHSKSPIIHSLFSKIMNKKYIYNSYNVPVNQFNDALSFFFKNNGTGANITVPFKEKAFLFADILSKEARISRSVNTLLKLRNGLIFGDNTDGKGLIYDLNRLNFLKNKYKVFIIGCGGAVKGIILSLFSYKCTIYIYNRTYLKALDLVKYFKDFGDIHALTLKEIEFVKIDLVIHATSLGILGSYPKLSNNFITSKLPCYDLFYSNTITPFLNWYSKNGGELFSDGLGMLISQAAYSFKLWHGVKPDIKKIIKILIN